MSDVPMIAIGGINIPKADREGTYASVVDNPAINLRLANTLLARSYQRLSGITCLGLTQESFERTDA